MAHFAKLDENNIVVEINVVDNKDIDDLPFSESEAVGVAFLTEWSGGHANWRQTSYNKSFRKNYAGEGFEYDLQRDAFIPPQPYPSFTLNEDTCLWEAPVAKPDDGQVYVWNEDEQAWVVYV